MSSYPHNMPRRSPSVVGLLPLLAVGSLLAVVACGDMGDPLPEDAIAVNEQGLYVYDTKLWSSPNIPVCWNTAGFAAEKGWVRDAVNRAWAQWAHVNLIGWGTCGANPAGINITINDVGPYSVYGTDSTTTSPSMVLNFTFINFRQATCSGANRAVCIRKIAVHEFGHALAFIHEHQRQDRPNHPNFVNNAGSNQWDKWTDDANSTTYGAYDGKSIMTYTYQWFDTNPNPVLSPTDIVGAQEAYGRKPRYSLVGTGGKCLDAVGGTVATGKKLQMYPCHGKANQRFELTPTLLRPRSSFLQVGASSTATYTQASIRRNYDNLFVMDRFELVGFGGKCLTETNGSWVRLRPCVGSDAQKWQHHGTNRMRSVGSGKCLRLSGRWLYTASCSAGAPVWMADGAIRVGSVQPTSCLDVAGGYSSLSFNFDPYLQVYTCKQNGVGSKNQRWIKRGQLRLHTNVNRCLDVAGGSTAQGARAQVYPCHGGSSQQFSHYF